MQSILIGILAGLAILVLAAIVFYITLPWTIRPALRALLWLRYRIRIVGLENIPRTRPVLFAANHVSWFDGFFLAATATRHGKALVSKDVIDQPIVRHLARRSGMIPTPFHGSKAIRAAIDATRKVLEEGHAIGIFPEGQISRNGLTGPFFRGLELMIKEIPDVAVVPAAIDNLWGSLASYSQGRFFKKRPQGWRRTVNIVFAPEVPPPVTAFKVRQALLVALVKAYAMRPKPRTLPETIDLNLPHWEDPKLGLLTASVPNLEIPGITQIGNREGTVGLPVPGVAIRVVDDQETELPPETVGELEAFVADHQIWTKTGRRGMIHANGFVEFVEA